MSKLKGLLSSTKGNEDSTTIIMPYNKRIEQYQKIIKRINQVYNKILVEPYLNLYIQISSLNRTTLESIKSMNNQPEFYVSMISLMVEVQKCYKNMNSEIKDYAEQGFIAIFQECDLIKKNVNNLFEKIKLHQTKEIDLIDDSKRYVKNQKSFLQAIDSYKVAFQDVKLIYNNEQKIKRYKICASIYGNLLNDLQQINANIEILTLTRQDLKVYLEEFREKSIQFVRIVSQQITKIPQNMIKCLIKGNKQVIKVLMQREKMFQEKSIKICFQKFRLPYPYPEKFDCGINQSQKWIYPNFLCNLKSLKSQNFGVSKKLLLQYYSSTREDIKQRQDLIEKVKNYLNVLSSLLDKLFVNEQKEVKQLLNQKYIKSIQSSFLQVKKSAVQVVQKPTTETASSSLPISKTLTSMLQFIDEEKQLSKNMNKIYFQKIKQLLQQLDQESKLLNLFKDEFKIQFYKLFEGKKQFKKDLENLQSGQLEGLSLTEGQIKQMREDIIKKSQFIVILINGFADKFKLIASKQKSNIQSFFQSFSKHLSYEKELYEKYKQIIGTLTMILFENRSKQPQNILQKKFWIDENDLYQTIVKQKLKIKFQSQVEKVNDFKKLKKPMADFDQKTVNLNISPKSSPQQSPRQFVQTGNNQNPVNLQNSQVLSIPPSTKSSQKKVEKKESGIGPFKIFFTKNHEQFIQDNIKFEDDQNYVSNFTCGLADNIIVSGRLYITTHRIFFNSRFNSSNIFFGGTKLQIPKVDIRKIEKRYNAVIFDNSISITTVNGQIFFTSFVSRDKAFDLICKTFDINHDQNVFISEQSIEQVQQNVQDFHVNIQQEDDLPDYELQNRAKQIDELIEKDQKSDQKASQLEYKNVLEWQLTFPGLNAVKLFKIFDSGQEMPYKGKTYDCFWHYFKENVHKNQDVDITSWQPNILQSLNPCNIKSSTPFKFCRKSQTNVPAPETSIPFMPKFIESQELYDLYFYSKDKYVIVNKVYNSKAPYTDCFYLRYVKTVELVRQNTVRIKSDIKIVFVKKAMVQGMIQAKTLKSSLENTESCRQEMQKYLKYLENTVIKKESTKKRKSLTNENGNSQETQGNFNNQLAVDNQQFQALQKQHKKLKKQAQSQSKGKNQWKIGFILSLLLNLLVLLLLFSGKFAQNQLPICENTNNQP